MFVQTKVTEEHRSGKDQSSGVSLVFSFDVKTDVTATGLKNSDFAAHVAARNNTRTTDEGSANVRQDTTVQVGHNHDIKLLGAGDSLHRSVVNDHVVGLQSWVVLGDLLESVAEETVGQFHDVGLVNASNLLAVVCQSKAKSEFGNALRLGAGNDLEGLDDTLDGLMLEARVFTLGVLADNAEIDILVSGLVSGNVLNKDNGSVDIELLAQSDVEGLVA